MAFSLIWSWKCVCKLVLAGFIRLLWYLPYWTLLGYQTPCYRKLIWLPVTVILTNQKEKARSSVHRVILGGECVMVDWIPSLCYKIQLNPAWGKQINSIQPSKWKKRNPKKSESMIWKNLLTRNSGWRWGVCCYKPLRSARFCAVL